ncbi:unnamed protein product [Scytosiphon promiscuus]
MDTLLGIAGEGFVVIAADAQVARSILLYKNDMDKIAHLADNKALASAGPQSDCVAFTEYISKNMALYELNNDVRLTTKAAANFIRGELAKALRKGPFQTQLLMGGVDKRAEGKAEASLFWLDYLGTMQKVPYGAHGYGAAFTLSVMDREYIKGLSLDEALGIIDNCIKELHTRFLIAQKNFVIKVVTAEGIKIVRGPPAQDLGAAGESTEGTPVVPAQA